MSFKKIADTSFKKQFRKLVLVMIALQIIFFHVILFCFLCMFICFCCCFWGACFVQISDNVSSPFSSKTFFLPSKFFSQKAYKSIIMKIQPLQWVFKKIESVTKTIETRYIFMKKP